MSEYAVGANQHTVSDRPWTDGNLMHELYVEQSLSQSQISDRLGCSRPTVRTWLKRHEITITGQPEQQPELRNPGTLQQLYSVEGRTAEEIGDELGCCAKTVLNWLRKHNIPVRDQSSPEALRSKDLLRSLYVEQGLTIDKIAEVVDCGWKTVARWLDRHEIETRTSGPRPSGAETLREEESLRELYVDDRLGSTRIAQRLECDPGSVLNWLRRHGIEIREDCWPTGENHSRWRGGVGRTEYGHAFDKNREKVIDRDDERCRRCGMARSTHREVYGRDIEVHHIEPFDPREPLEPQHRLANLITLCKECHDMMRGIPIDNRHVEEQP